MPFLVKPSQDANWKWMTEIPRRYVSDKEKLFEFLNEFWAERADMFSPVLDSYVIKHGNPKEIPAKRVDKFVRENLKESKDF